MQFACGLFGYDVNPSYITILLYLYSFIKLLKKFTHYETTVQALCTLYNMTPMMWPKSLYIHMILTNNNP